MSLQKPRSKQLKIRQPPRRFLTLGRIFSGILAICTLLGLFAFYPRVVVDPEGDIDRTDPFASTFKIRNTGFIPLWNVQPMIGVCEIEVGIPKALVKDCHGPLNSRLVLTTWKSKIIKRDETQTIELKDLLDFKQRPDNNEKLYYANFSIVIEFEPWFIPLKMEQEFRFISELQQTGKMIWRTKPVDQ